MGIFCIQKKLIGVTNKEIRFVNMEDVALKTVKSMIGEDFTTQMDY